MDDEKPPVFPESPHGPEKPKEPQPAKPSLKDKLFGHWEEFRKHEKVEGFVQYTHSNTRDAISYVLLIIGLTALFISPLSGGLLVGIVAAVYFSKEILYFITHLRDFVDYYGTAKMLILIGILVAFLIQAPAIFLGALLALALQQLLLFNE